MPTEQPAKQNYGADTDLVPLQDVAEAAREFMGPGAGAGPLTCPVRALRTWLNVASIEDGPVFRSEGSLFRENAATKLGL